jgi:hypothetical protein
VHFAVGTSLVSFRNGLQLPQVAYGAAAGGGGLGVSPEPGSGVALASGKASGKAISPIESPTESSAEFNGLRRGMADIVAPFECPEQREKVTPWSRIDTRRAVLAEHVAERAGVAPSRFSGQHFAPLRGVVPSTRYAVA